MEYEYTVAQIHEGKWKLYRWLMIAGYAIFAASYFFIAYKSRFIPIVAILPLFMWMLVYFTYKYVNPEYKYTVSEATLRFFVIYGKTEKERLSLRICDADFIIPLETALEKIKEYAPKHTISALPTSHGTDSYIILYKNSEGEPSAFIFKATSEALKALKFYNKNTVITDTDL